jgi:spore coat polysaccharide biosynthesis predicted glycosyltransferase SpsG
MRSRTVAQAMQASGASTRMVIIGDSYVDNLMVGRGLDYRIVKSESEAVAICHEYTPQVVVFDLLRFTEAHFREVAGTAMTVSLSPVFNLLSQVDLIFHRTHYLGDAWPRGEGAPITRCGLEYAVINQNCRKIPDGLYQRQLEFKELAVAVSMGGTDAANKTLQVLDTIKKIPHPLLVWVILGEGYGHSYQELVDSMRGEAHEIILVKTNDSLWRILSTCSLAILSGGTTAYEAAYAGLPAINLIESEKRAFLIQELVDKGVGICAESQLL